MRRGLLVGFTAALVLALGAGPALACGALVSPNGTIQLVRTTTLAAYHDGVEHYVTGFKFVGDGAKFGSIVPLPAIPSKIVRGGDWTLQRLVREVRPPLFAFRAVSLHTAGAAGNAVVLQEKDIDALHLTVLKGGGFAVGKWATEHGFVLPPDAPTVLDFYADRSPIFMAVQFDAKKAARRGENQGDAIPIHLVMPTKEPWVPLRILGLGAPATSTIEADVFLLTDQVPNMLPVPVHAAGVGQRAPGLRQQRSEEASRLLLRDLRKDKGMGWLPNKGMWLTFLTLDARAGDLTYDLALNVHHGAPSPVDAGLSSSQTASPPSSGSRAGLWAIVAAVALLGTMVVVAARERRGSGRIAI